MKILFIGYGVNPQEGEKLTGISIAGNKMQINCLRGLNRFDDVELSSITIYPVAAYPRDSKIWYGGKKISVIDDISSYRVPFLNLPIIKQLWQTWSVWNAAEKFLDKDSIILTFNMFPQVGLPAIQLKKKYGNKVISLLADLPIDDHSGSNTFIGNRFRRIFDEKTRYALQECDAFITLNKNAVDQFAPGKNYMVMEGGIDLATVTEPSFKEKQEKRIIYSGALTEYSGIQNLVAAMEYVSDKDAVLEVYGGGYLQEEIIDASKRRKNIKYCGRVANSEMLAKQKEAFLLINPRPTDDPIAQVTFPSKIFEYMVSGTPVLTTKLNGLNEDYFEHLYLAEEETPQGLASSINKILKKSSGELTEKARGAYQFIVQNKNWEVQTRRIHDFIAAEAKR